LHDLKQKIEHHQLQNAGKPVPGIYVHNGVGLMVGSPAVTHQFLDLQLTNHGFSAKSPPLLSGA
jgi:hypothetical protein